MTLPTLSDEISQSALDHYGIPHQAMKWIEELQELTLEIIGYLEGSNLMSLCKHFNRCYERDFKSEECTTGGSKYCGSYRILEGGV